MLILSYEYVTLETDILLEASRGERMMDATSRSCPPKDGKATAGTEKRQRGIALVIVMIAVSIMMLLSFALLTSALMETTISGNYRTQTQAFYIAEAGVEQAKTWLRSNMYDTPLVNALLTEAVGATLSNPPDQSSLTVGATTVNTPLGTQTFGDGTYTVWIGDNKDDGDETTDADQVYVITSRGNGPDNATKLIEVMVFAPSLEPSAALNLHGQDSHPDFDQGSGGTGNRIPPITFDGNPHDINGNPGATGCPPVPTFATDHPDATGELLDDLDDLRSDIVKRANSFCAADGSPSTMPTGPGGPCTGSNCCTPGLWWIRGSAAMPRFDDSDPASYSLMPLSVPELHATDADYITVTQPPSVTLPSPESAPFAGTPGNTTDPSVSQVAPADMQDDLDAIQTAIDQTPAADKITITDGRFDDGGTHTYGSITGPKVVTVTDVFRIENFTTFTGAGILIVENLMRIEDSIFEWTGIVIIRGSSPELRSRGGGQINGALFFDSDDGTVRVDVDKATDDLQITYSCEAISMALLAVPLSPLSWLELHQ